MDREREAELRAAETESVKRRRPDGQEVDPDDPGGFK